MIGASARIAKTNLHPDAFRYYLPPLLVGALDDLDYLDRALECLLPAGHKRRTDRKEWMDFHQGFSERQRDAIRSYLKGIRSTLGDSIGPIEQHLFDELDTVWAAL